MEKSILNLFLYEEWLKFNEIEKRLNCRSNKLAYHLMNMIKSGKLIKENNNYKLSDNYCRLIPYITDKDSVIAVILIAMQKEGKTFLIKRNKRPFKNNKWCMPGGRLIVGETISNAVNRIMLEKYNIKAKYNKINSISLEHVKEKGKIIHSFMLIFVTAKTKDNLQYQDINKLKNNMVESDYILIKKDINLTTKINSLYSKN